MSRQEITARPMYRYLIILTIAGTAGLQGWRTLFNNFSVEIAHLSGEQIGWIQGIREVPGFLALLAIFVMRFIPEYRLGAISLLTLGAGIALTGFLPDFQGLILTTTIMSFGFHYYETVSQSLTLQYFDRQSSPFVLGQMRSVAAAANIVAGLLIFGLSDLMAYSWLYLLFGAGIILIVGYSMSGNPTEPHLPVQRNRFILKKKYSLFYWLTFLAGARRQILVAFAVFLMVEKFGFTVREITVLFILNNIINYYLNPAIGRAINRFGEQKLLTIEYLNLVIIFLAYTWTGNRWVVALLYILDQIFFNFAVAIRTFFQKIAEPQDIAPSMAVGFTINHIAAVIIPVAGGILWMADYRIPFWLGAFLGLLSLISVQFINRSIRRQNQPADLI
jgi:MFS family permease